MTHHRIMTQVLDHYCQLCMYFLIQLMWCDLLHDVLLFLHKWKTPPQHDYGCFTHTSNLNASIAMMKCIVTSWVTTKWPAVAIWYPPQADIGPASNLANWPSCLKMTVSFVRAVHRAYIDLSQTIVWMACWQAVLQSEVIGQAIMGQ